MDSLRSALSNPNDLLSQKLCHCLNTFAPRLIQAVREKTAGSHVACTGISPVR